MTLELDVPETVINEGLPVRISDDEGLGVNGLFRTWVRGVVVTKVS
jgi:hypothetical protein